MKVFISSTYIDLVEHRKAAINSLERLGHEVGRMEVFGARAEEATTVALDELDKSDIVIGIYAHRYGFIPEGSDISITEQEYVHARMQGKPVLCFITDEEYPWSPRMMEKNIEKIEKLDNFKSRILKEKVVEFFTSPADLGMKVTTSIQNYLEEYKHISDSQIPTLEHHKPTDNNLPTQSFFFGRVEELKTIAAAISPETRAWGALIDGPGGIGKTALAIKAAYDAPDKLFERKIFITAKVRELTLEGEKKLADLTSPTYFALLGELGKELGEENLAKLPPEDRPNALRLALSGRKSLIIFDNLETLPEEERTQLFLFLSRLPEGNKAIVTSRRRSDVDARIVRLDRLSYDDAMRLIAELAFKNPRLTQASQKERDDLYAISQGNPLFIQWIVGQLGREGSKIRTIAEASTFLTDAPKGNDPLEYIFGDLLETFTENETKVLAALTHFTQPAKLNWLAQMTDLPERATETALEDLADRSILISNPESRTFYLPPLTAQFIKTRRSEVVAKTGDALMNRAYALTLQNGGNDNYEGFHTLDSEWEFVSSALPHILQGDNNRLQSVCSQLSTFLEFTGRWDEGILLFEHAEVKILNSGDKEGAGWQAYRAGSIYLLRGQTKEALDCAKRAETYWKAGGNIRKQAIALSLRGRAYILEKDYPNAVIAYSKALDLDNAFAPKSSFVAADLMGLAQAKVKLRQLNEAERSFNEALRLLKDNRDNEGITTALGNLAELKLEQQQWVNAESLAREALPLAEKIGRQELIAHACNYLAIALLKQNQTLDDALSLTRRAVEIYKRLRHPDLQAAQKTLAEIEKAVG